MKNPFCSRLWMYCLMLAAGIPFPLNVAAQTTNCVPAPSGLIGIWRGDGNTFDPVGTNDGVTPYGIAYASGVVGQAFDFDGSNRRVSIPDQPAFRLTNSLTIEGWVYPRTLPGGFIFFRGDNRGGLDTWTLDVYTTGYLNFQIDDESNNYAHVLAPIQTNQWQHVAATLDGATGDMKLYINGVLIAQTNTTVRPIGDLDPSYEPAIGIGNHGGTFHQFPFNGLIDEISLYNRALSSSEVQAIYSADAAGKCVSVQPPPSCVAAPAGLVSWWQAENNAADSTGGKNGTLPNGGSFVPGEVGNAFRFDGSNQCVQIPYSPSLISSNFTVETWVKPLSQVDDAIGQEVIFGQSYGALQLLVRSGTTGVRVAWQFGTDHYNFYWTEAASELPIGQYSHVAGTWDGITLRLYVNGVLASESTPGTSPVDSGCDFSIGGFYLPQAGDCQYVGQFFNGEIDEVSLYNRPLSPNDVQNIYNVGSAGKCTPMQPPPSCATAPAGLVSWWKSQNNALDSISGNNGTPSGNLSYGAGKVGQAFLLDGTNSSITVPASASLNVQSLTIEGWINPADVSEQIPIAEYAAATGWSGVHLWISVPMGGGPGTLFANVRSASAGLDQNIISSAPGLIKSNEWSHVALTFDQASGLAQLYLNGTNVASRNLGSIIPNTALPFNIGLRPATGPEGGAGATFRGKIDELSLYNRALAASEIADIYSADYVGKCRVPLVPFITTQPFDRSAYVGGTTSFNVVATGDAPLNYQWLFNGEVLSGRTSAALTLGNLQLTNSGNYSVVITNPIGSITSVVAVLTVKLPPPCTPPPAGLVSWWKFENNVIDNWDSNDGVALNGSGFAAGKVGMAFNAIGSRYVRVADSPSLRLTNGLTLSAWVNPSIQSGSTPRTIVAKSDYPGYTPSGMQSSFILGTTNNGQLYFTVSGSGSVRTNTRIISAQALPLNQWTLVAATYDGNVLQLYTNGILAAATNYSGGISASTSDIGIGGIAFNSSIPGWPFTGLIDEVSIFNRALTADEIKAAYDADFTGMCAVAPIVTANPLSQAVPLGEDVRFPASVTGSRPMRYQWRFNGANIARATNAALILEKITGSNAGFYSVFVSNNVGTALSASAQLKLLPAPSCVTPPDGLISWWPLDGSGADVTGTNNLQFLILTSPAYPTGKVDRAFNFAGLSSAAGRVVAPKSLDFGITNNFSIEAWIRTYPTKTSPIQWQLPGSPNVSLIEKRVTTTLPTFPSPAVAAVSAGYSLSLYNGRLALLLGGTPVSSTSTAMFQSSDPDLRDGIFHHIAATVDRSSSTGGNLYVDGQSVLTFDPTIVRGSLSNSGPLIVGGGGQASPLERYSYFYGLMDEIAIYSRALSSAEVQSIALAGAAGKCKVPPSILVQPTNQTVSVGSNAAFSVLATGQLPLRYQWFKGGIATVFGATNATYSLTNVQLLAAGTYSVRVTNAFGSVLSSNVFLVVNKSSGASKAMLRYERANVWTLQFQGTAGQAYQVQVSTNLTDWKALGAATDLGGGNFGFTDPDQNTRPAGFYRIIQP